MYGMTLKFVKKKKTKTRKKITQKPHFKNRLLLGIIIAIVIVGGFIIYRSLAAPQLQYTLAQRYGMTIMNIPWLSDSERQKQLDLAKAAGVHMLKFDLTWSNVQADGPNSYNWQPFDTVVLEAKSRGFIVMADLTYSPKWAIPAAYQHISAKSDYEKYAPANNADFANFAQAAAQHYKGSITAFEIWNEANNTGFYRPRVDVAKYTDMLKQSYLKIKSVNPDMVVVTSGLAPDGTVGFVEPDGSRMNPVTYLQFMYAAGAHNYFDAVGWHPYNTSGCPNQKVPWSAWYQMYGTNPSVQSVMKQRGDEGKKIWITEWDYPSAETELASEAWQQQCMIEGFQFVKANPWIGPVVWFPLKDGGPGDDPPADADGLLRKDGTKKPSFDTYLYLSASSQNTTPK